MDTVCILYVVLHGRVLLLSTAWPPPCRMRRALPLNYHVAYHWPCACSAGPKNAPYSVLQFRPMLPAGPFDIYCGDAGYWVFTFLYIPFTVAVASYVACYLMYDTKKKTAIEYPWLKGKIPSCLSPGALPQATSKCPTYSPREHSSSAGCPSGDVKWNQRRSIAYPLICSTYASRSADERDLPCCQYMPPRVSRALTCCVLQSGYLRWHVRCGWR